MPYSLPPIVKTSERLLLELEQAVRTFPRYHKYRVGDDIRRQAMQVTRLCHRAWRDRARQQHWTEQTIWAIDELKISLQLASQLRAFRSFAQFEHVIRIAATLGRQAGGWRKKQHRKGQNQAHPAALERAQTLSARAASPGAKS